MTCDRSQICDVQQFLWRNPDKGSVFLNRIHSKVLQATQCSILWRLIANWSVTFSRKSGLYLEIFSRCMLSIHKPERRSSAMIDRSHVLTLLIVQKDLSAVHVDTGRVSNKNKASLTAEIHCVCHQA